jgi:hypothetical protein
MRQRRYEMLLPLAHNDGRRVDPAKHENTHEELVATFGALSHLPAAVRGVWVHEGQRYEEDFIRLLVDVPDRPTNRKFFVRLKAKLLERVRTTGLWTYFSLSSLPFRFTMFL